MAQAELGRFSRIAQTILEIGKGAKGKDTRRQGSANQVHPFGGAVDAATVLRAFFTK